MFNSYRIIGTAFGLIVLLCSLALADPPSQQSKQWQGKQSAQSQQSQSGPVKSFHPNFIDWFSAKFGVTGCGPYSVDRFGHANQIENAEYYRACDLEAQESSANSTRWLLLIAGLQTCLAIFGTWLVWRTLKFNGLALKTAQDSILASREANLISREIGESQIRAYLYCKSAKYRLEKDEIYAKLDIGNSGQSPASDITISGELIIHDVGGRQSMPRVLSWLRSDQLNAVCQPIFPNGNATEEIGCYWPSSFEFEDEEFELKEYIFRGGNEVMYDLVISWADVFGRKHEFPIELSAIIDASPYSPRKKRGKSGTLDFRAADTRAKVVDAKAEDHQ
jgi:hypothetical protein